jgi:hypothetical protein
MTRGTDRWPVTQQLESSSPELSGRARTLDQLADEAREMPGVWARDLRAGDWVIVRTKNSLYSLAVLGNGTYAVAGGWFAAAGAETTPVRVSGCTWGGPAILTGMVAAPRMFLEFDNGVRTTRIHEVRVIRDGAEQRPH